MQSESELHSLLTWFIGIGTADIDVLQALALSSAEFLGFYSNLIPLLEHPNTDIGNKIVETFHEIFHDEEGFVDQEEIEIISKLSDNCLKSDLFLYFNGHARKLHESKSDIEDPDDNQAIYQIFEIIEDILELNNLLRNSERSAEFYKRLNGSNMILFLMEIFKQDPKLVKSCSMSSLVSSGDYSNRLYAAELIATIFQLSAIELKDSEHVKSLWTSSIDGLIIIESLLVSISPYRNRDPIDSDEQEYLFNLFDCLGALLLNSPAARKSFCSEHCEGIELFLMFLKETNVARIRAIQIIDYLLASEDTSQEISEKFINSGGLKVISPILMGKGITKLMKNYPKLLLSIDHDESHVCAIIASLFKNIPTNSVNYFRLISKFIENSGEKTMKLIEIHEKYSQKLKTFDKEHGITNPSDESDEWLLDRINAGLFVLQQVDICLLILYNSKSILNLIENKNDQIEQELFEIVSKESEIGFAKLINSELLKEIKVNVKEFIDELDGTILIVNLLKTFL